MIPFRENVYLTEYASLRETKSLCEGFIQYNLELASDVAKLQQIRAIEKANGLNFD